MTNFLMYYQPWYFQVLLWLDKWVLLFHQLSIQFFTVRWWHKCVLLTMDQKHRNIYLLDAINVVEAFIHEQAKELSCYICSNFFNCRVWWNTYETSCVEKPCKCCCWTCSNWTTKHENILCLEAKASIWFGLQYMLHNDHSVCCYFTWRAFLLLSQIIFLINYFETKHAIPWIFHSKNWHAKYFT